MSNLDGIKVYREILIYLISEDMQFSNISTLARKGFKGLENYTLDELEHSVIDRYEIELNNELDIVKLLVTIGE